jgi:ubiquinone/menaquinone biosynthesis C-methylase UbiE
MEFTKPERNISFLGLMPGMQVADFGAGSGHYVLGAARAVGEHGLVYAIDVQKNLLTAVKNTAKQEKLKNIEVIWSDLEAPHGSTLRDGAVDALIISNLLFQVANKEAVLNEAARVVKLRGRILLIDWSESFAGLGPHSGHVVSTRLARELLTKAGFGNLRPINVGPHHYGWLGEKER